MARRPWGVVGQRKRGAGRGDRLCKGPGVLGGGSDGEGARRLSEGRVVGDGSSISRIIPDVSGLFSWERSGPQIKPKKPACHRFYFYSVVHQVFYVLRIPNILKKEKWCYILVQVCSYFSVYFDVGHFEIWANILGCTSKCGTSLFILEANRKGPVWIHLALWIHYTDKYPLKEYCSKSRRTLWFVILFKQSELQITIPEI